VPIDEEGNWFEPRGIASVLYLLLVVNLIEIEGDERILAIIVLTVLLSLFLHGISALHLSHRYGNRTNKIV
jgi:NhaP-type Na+/H+ or K+/H+ antiporter